MRLQDETEALHTVINDIYTSTLDHEHWTNTLSNIDNLVGGSGTIYVRVVGDGTGYKLPEVRHSDMADTDIGFDTYMKMSHMDPRVPYSRTIPFMSVFTDYDFISDAEIDAHPFYNEFLAPWDMRYTVGSTMPGTEDDFLMLASMRSKTHGPPEAKELRLGQIISCHVGRSSEIERRLAGHVTMQKALKDSLDHVPDGILIVRPDGRLIYRNKAASVMLSENNPLTEHNGLIRPAHRATQQTFEKLLSNIAATDQVTKPVPDALPLPSPLGQSPYQACLMPLTGSESRTALMDGIAQGAILIVVSNPFEASASNADRLALLFDLTPAEARLAEALSKGLSVSSYSEQRSITENTVRWTLKRLMMKTETSRQSELVRLFSTSAAQWQRQ